MTIKLHVFPQSPRGFKALFAAEQLGVDYEMVFVDFTKQAQRGPGFTALNPNQRMPVLEDGDFVLWESNAIVQYLASLKPESGALPSDLKARMATVKWQFWESAHWDPALAPFMFENVVKALFGIGAPDPAELKRAAGLVARLAPVLEAQLQKTRFVAGDAADGGRYLARRGAPVGGAGEDAARRLSRHPALDRGDPRDAGLAEGRGQDEVIFLPPLFAGGVPSKARRRGAVCRPPPSRLRFATACHLPPQQRGRKRACVTPPVPPC